MNGIILRNGRVVDPSQGLDAVRDIRILDGKIAEIGPQLSSQGETEYDCSGKAVFPGLVDMHVHLRDPGFTHKEDILTGCEAAAAGGVTSVAAMPNTKPVADSPQVLAYVAEKARQAKAHVYQVASITAGMKGEALNDFPALKAAGAIAVSDDGRPVENGRMMKEALERAYAAGLPVISHCEDLSIINGGIVNDGPAAKTLGVKGMSRASEDSVTAREIALAHATGAAIHIAHVSTEGSIALIRDAKARGVSVTCETCPHYFMLTEQEVLSRDADYRMNPPLREDSDRRAVLLGILDGTVDCIVTDHAPHAAEEKADFLTAPNGVVGLETSFAAALTSLYHTGLLPLSRIVELMSQTPAKLLGIPAGSLKPGSPADIAVADLNQVWTVEPDKLHSKSHNTVFKGRTLQGKVTATLLSGRFVYQE